MTIIEEKIQIIAKEIMEANASEWTITKIVKELTEMNTTSEKKLREKSQKLLEELDPSAALIYNKFNQMKVYTTNEKILPFNRGHIIKSLLKETILPRNIAEKITLEVENQIKDAKIEYLNTILIRELVNAKLISYNYEEIRNNYARFGEAAYDIKQKIENEPYFGNSVREYNISLIISKKARELHCSGEIHIEDIEGYSSRIFAHTHLFEKYSNEDETISKNLKEIIQKQKKVFLPINIYGISHTMSEFSNNSIQSKKIGKKLLNYLQILPKDTDISIELFTPEIIKYKGKKNEAVNIANELIDKQNCTITIDSPFELKLINTLNKPLRILNCSEKEYFPLNKEYYSPTQTINTFININLEKLAQENEFGKFIEELKITSEEIKKIEKQKNEILSKKTYLKEFFIENNKTGVGITNLEDLTKKFPEMKNNECIKKTIKELNKLFEEQILFDQTVNARKKFDQINAQYKEVDEGLLINNYYKNNFIKNAKTIKEVEDLIKEKIKLINFENK